MLSQGEKNDESSSHEFTDEDTRGKKVLFYFSLTHNSV